MRTIELDELALQILGALYPDVEDPREAVNRCIAETELWRAHLAEITALLRSITHHAQRAENKLLDTLNRARNLD